MCEVSSWTPPRLNRYRVRESTLSSFPHRAVVSGADGTFLLPAVMMWHGVPLVGVLDRFDTMRMKVESPGYRSVGREYCHSCDVDHVRIALEPG